MHELGTTAHHLGQQYYLVLYDAPGKTCMEQYDGSVLRQLHAMEMAGFSEALLALLEALTAPS